ncbi:MAG: type II secretion system protein [Minisyncoccia bacterium]
MNEPTITSTRARGFTLIELLVVIAIIGVLSSIVIASLSSARSKGSDAAIQSDLHGIQVQAELYNITNSGYGTAAYATTCSAGMYSDATIARSITAANNVNGAGNVYCYASTNAYLIAADLVTSGYWCIDSTGVAKAESGAAPSSAPAGNVCP